MATSSCAVNDAAPRRQSRSRGRSAEIGVFIRGRMSRDAPFTRSDIAGQERSIAQGGTGRKRYSPAPWHFLYFFPDPHGHGSLRPISLSPAIGVTEPTVPSGVEIRGGGGAGTPAGPVNRSSSP